MTNPRLFVASGIFHPEPGGPATYLHEILPALQARGWQVHVLTYGDPAIQGEYPYPVQRIARGLLPLRLFNYARAARRALAQADLAYLHTTELPLIGYAQVPRVMKIVGDRAWERSIERGWIAPDTDIDDFQLVPYDARVEAFKESRTRQVQAMRAVIVPSEYLKRMVVGWGIPAERVHVVYNALPDWDGVRLPQAEARAQLGLPAGPALLTAARLTPWKGIDHLLAALHRTPDWQLWIAGTGEDEARLRALAAPLGERVRFLGRLPREQLYLTMQAADYFALYSGYEGLAHTLLESLRVGTPVIASARGGNSEVVRDGSNGLLVPHVNVEALADALQRALQPGLRASLAAHAGDDLERFRFSTMLEQTDAVLRACLRP